MSYTVYPNNKYLNTIFLKFTSYICSPRMNAQQDPATDWEKRENEKYVKKERSPQNNAFQSRPGFCLAKKKDETALRA